MNALYSNMNIIILWYSSDTELFQGLKNINTYNLGGKYIK